MSGKIDHLEIAKLTIVLASTTGKVSLCNKNINIQDPTKLIILSLAEEFKDIGNF